MSAEDRVAAESLFGDARRSMLAGDYAQACPKLEASRRLEPAVGTTLNLGDCYEKLGRTASAWAEFKSAAAEAQRLGDSVRKATAVQRAAALEPRLSRLRIDVIDPSVTVFRDGQALSSALLGSAIPVDPGTIRLEARAPGKQAWTREVAIAADGAQMTLQIPALEDETSAAASLQSAPPKTGSNGSGQAWAWVLGGVGAAALATGATMGLLASSNWSKAKDECGDLPYDCSPGAVTRADDASTQANVATAAFIVGGAALGASLVLFATSAEDDSPGAELALTPSSLSLRGRW